MCRSKTVTYVVDQPVNDLLYQPLLVDELLLGVDLRFDLLQVPVDHGRFLQLLLLFG